MKKAVKIEIMGSVQGIFFRSFIKEKADKLNVKGYVRNKVDGNVEAWLEGNNTEVDELIDICKEGPEHAIIKDVKIKEEHYQGLTEFKILRM